MSLTCISYIPHFSPNIVPMCFHSVCARTGKIAMLAYTYSLPFTVVRVCIWAYCLLVFTCCLPLACVRAFGYIAYLRLFAAFHWRACIVAYRLPALFFRFPSACMHCGVSPACVVFYRLPPVCLHCGVSPTCVVLPPLTGVRVNLHIHAFHFPFVCVHWSNCLLVSV